MGDLISDPTTTKTQPILPPRKGSHQQHHQLSRRCVDDFKTAGIIAVVKFLFLIRLWSEFSTGQRAGDDPAKQVTACYFCTRGIYAPVTLTEQVITSRFR